MAVELICDVHVNAGPDAVGSCVAECVLGPVLGHFVGAYAVRTGDGFVGYGKVFRERPANPWEGAAFLKVSTPCFQRHDSALENVLRAALTRLRRLPAVA